MDGLIYSILFYGALASIGTFACITFVLGTVVFSLLHDR